MRTIFIYDTSGDAGVYFFERKGDYSYLDGIYFNHLSFPDDDYRAKEAQLKSIVDEVFFDWEQQVRFPVQKDLDFKVIVCGYVPE